MLIHILSQQHAFRDAVGTLAAAYRLPHRLHTNADALDPVLGSGAPATIVVDGFLPQKALERFLHAAKQPESCHHRIAWINLNRELPFHENWVKLSNARELDGLEDFLTGA